MAESGFDSLKRGWTKYPSLFLLLLGACSAAPAISSESAVLLQPAREPDFLILKPGQDAGALAKPEGARALAWESEEAEARSRARRKGAPMLVYLRAEWAAACAEMERDVWTDARVIRRARHFVLLKIDVSSADLEEDLYVQRYGVRVIPSVVLFDVEGRRAGLISGRGDAEALLRIMEEVLEFGASNPRD